MEAIALIVSALAAGASAGAIGSLKDDAKGAAKAAYEKVRGLAAKRVAGRPDGRLVLDRHHDEPEAWERVLANELIQAGAGDDGDLVAAAQTLLDLLDDAGASATKYHVTVKDSRGLQVGDRNVQVNKF